MNYTEFGFGRFESEIAAVAKQFDFDLNNLEIEFFTPGRQAIFVETVETHRFRIHVNLEENRIISAKQLVTGPAERINEALFAKYKNFMK
jgi:hypothetical protein